MLVGICVRVKNEDILLNEFVAHYINLGFDKIHIFDNNSVNSVTDTIAKLKQKYDNIISIENDYSTPHGPKWGQTHRYNEFLDKNRNLTWILNCDADEFIYLHKHTNIKDFLSEFKSDTAVIPVNWVTYGTSNLETFDSQKLVMEQFVIREDYKSFWNYFVKSFIRPNLITEIKNWHFHDSGIYKTQNVYGEEIIRSELSTFVLTEKRRDELNNETPCVMVHYMTLDFENMLKKHNKNKGFLMSMDDIKYTREWYATQFKDNNFDNRMFKYIPNVKLILNSL